MLTLNLPDSVEKQLEKLSAATGRSKHFIVEEAVKMHLEELHGICRDDSSAEPGEEPASAPNHAPTDAEEVCSARRPVL